MPGIAGIISKTYNEKNKKDLHLMIDCMMHEPFYTSGTYINVQVGLYAGWVCHKGSFSDCMPVFNEKKDLMLLFSGENFIDKNVIDRLRRQGHEFDGSNAGYLIHLYEEEGDRFLQQLNGWFSGILVNLRNAKVVLFNDRYGMQRVYYYEGKDEFIFSSEAKSLLKIRPGLREMDMRGLGEFFSCGCVLENRTLFPRIFLMPGGSSWTSRNGSMSKKEYYFKPDIWENQPVLEEEVFYEELKETFISILPRYFRSEQQVAMSLTGGLDTRMIMACMDHSSGKLPCYTYGGMYRDCFDVRIAGKVAAECQQTHQILHIDEEFLTGFPYYAEKTIYITDGCLDICGSHELFLSRLAREIAPIRMTGNYGSEVLRSVNYIKAALPHEELFHPDFNRYAQEAVKLFADTNEGHQLSYSVFKLIPRHLYGRLASAQSQLTLRTPYMDNDLVALMYRASAEIRNTKEISLRLIADGNPALNKIMTDRGVGGDSRFLFSRGARLYYEFLFKAEYYYNDGMPHWLAKFNRTFAFLNLEEIFLGRHKIEHYRKWFRNELSDYIRQMLLDERTLNRPYLNNKYLIEIVNRHIKGTHNYTKEISKVLTAELIQRLLIEQK